MWYSADNVRNRCPPVIEIALGPHDDAGNIRNPTKVHNLVIHNLDHVERVPRGYRVDQNVSMNSYGMLSIDWRIFVL